MERHDAGEHSQTPKGTAPAALYFGDVMHARLKPMKYGSRGHRFTYRVFSLLIDLDRLDEADRMSPLFGVNRAALYSFRESDHGNRDGSSLCAYVNRIASEKGIDLRGGQVQLLCYPRLFGYTFNPLSVYFCRDASGKLALLIYEVRNTFGEIHSYALPVRPDELSQAGVRQEQNKLFYVSPFVEMAMRYYFRVSPPEDSVKLRILETDSEGPLLSATFHGSRKPLTTASLLLAFVNLPFVTFKIMAAIHWEALRLWLKGAKLVERPKQLSPGERPAQQGPNLKGLGPQGLGPQALKPQGFGH
ncbi:MAG: DUF1365 domain-containing protein [Pseudomonadota bacterium]